MKNKTLVFLLTLLFLIVILITYFSSQFSNNRYRKEELISISNSLPLTIETSSQNIALAENYNDEPNVGSVNYKVSSSSAWIIPDDPLTIHADPHYEPMIIDKQEESFWERWSASKEALDNLNLEPVHYNFFFNSGNLPQSIKKFDANSDEILDYCFVSIGTGCGSCHQNYVDIFIGDKRYFTTTNEGEIYPRNDGKGFYLSTAMMGDEFATCCPDRFVLKKYEWNGNGFTEIVRKTVYLKTK